LSARVLGLAGELALKFSFKRTRLGKGNHGYDTANYYPIFMPFLAGAGAFIALNATKFIVSGFFPEPLFLCLFDKFFEDV
jgi:hypothetical protein